MMGHSAGGHLVAFAGADESVHTRRDMDPDAVRGYIAISAIWDVADMHGAQDGAFRERVTYRVFGRDPAAWVRVSPMNKLHPRMKPFLIMVGDHDYSYLIRQASMARDRLSALGARPAFYVAKGNDHDRMVLAFGALGDNMSDAVVAFVRDN
jgi:acetyl esterase/lipase